MKFHFYTEFLIKNIQKKIYEYLQYIYSIIEISLINWINFQYKSQEINFSFYPFIFPQRN